MLLQVFNFVLMIKAWVLQPKKARFQFVRPLYC